MGLILSTLFLSLHSLHCTFSHWHRLPPPPPHTHTNAQHINGIWWALFLCLQLTSHTCWTSSHTQLFVWARCVCFEDECVCCNVLGPGSTTASLPETHAHTHSQIDTVFHPIPTHGGAYTVYLSFPRSSSPSLFNTHMHKHTHKSRWAVIAVRETVFLVICPVLWTCQMWLLIHFTICGER